MHASRVMFTGRGQVEFQNVEVGKPDPDELLVETLYSAISPGTESAFLMAEPNTATRARGFPFMPGYSNVGRVIEVGSEIKSFHVGQLVASNQAHVSHYRMTETTGPGRRPEKPRASAEPNLSFAPLYYIWPLQDGLEEKLQKASACFGIVGVGMTGARYAKIDLGESVLVLGLGPIGLYAALLAKLGGAVPVLGLDRNQARRKIALTMGVDAVYATPEELADGHPMMAGKAPQVVIEATGRPEVIPLAFQLCGRNGRVVLLGSTRGVTENVDFYNDVHRKGITIIGAHVPTRPTYESHDGRWTAWDEDLLVLRLIAAGRLDCSPMIAREFPAAKVADAYGLIQESPETMGVILDWTK